MPVHDEADIDGRWRCPGAWTSDDDVLDDQALTIIAGLNRLPPLIPATSVLADHPQQEFLGPRAQTSLTPRQSQPISPPFYVFNQEDLLPAFPGETPPPSGSLTRSPTRVSSDFLQSPSQPLLVRLRKSFTQMNKSSVLGVWVFICLITCLAYFWGVAMPYIIEGQDFGTMTWIEQAVQRNYKLGVGTQVSW